MKDIDILRKLYLALEKFNERLIGNYLIINPCKDGIKIRVYDYLKLKKYEVMTLNNYADLQVIMKYYNTVYK